MDLRSHLAALGVDILHSFEQLGAPAALVDAAGTVLWQNAAALAFVGDQRGVRFGSIAADYQQESRASLARKRHGVKLVDHARVVLVDKRGRRTRAETVSVSLMRDSEFVGVLAFVGSVREEGPAADHDRLTPRQHETLFLLAEGLSTEQIADRLGVARETARNYIRRLLRVLGVHSRLEAVVKARELDLL
jgi:DNA-binding CsgD family transcriptional regulator